MRVQVSEPRLLPQLVDSLLRSDCVATRVDDRTFEVLHADAHDEHEARVELLFFLRAWANGHPDVRAELVG
jgi:hypothetical protein